MLFNKKYKQPSIICQIYNWFKYPRIIYLDNQNNNNAMVRAIRCNNPNNDGSYDYIIQETSAYFDVKERKAHFMWICCEDCRPFCLDSKKVPFENVEHVLSQLEYWYKP